MAKAGRPEKINDEKKHRGHHEGSWNYDDDTDKWRFRVSCKTPDGTTKRFAVTAATKGECRDLAKEKAEQIEKGIGLNLDTKNITVAEYLKRWIVDYVDPVRSYSTQNTYRCLINSCLTENIGDIKLKILQRAACQRHFNDLAKKEWSTSTIAGARNVLHSCLEQAVRDKIIGENPATGLKLQKVKCRERMAYSPTEVQKILVLVADQRCGIGFHLVFAGALRMGEMLGLRWGNVDLQKNKINIIEQLSREKGIVYGKLKTTMSNRSLPISPALAAELKAHRTQQKEMLLKSGIAWTEEFPVLANEIGEPVSHATFLKDYKAVMKEAGLKSTGTHDARHTCLTILGNNLRSSGMDPKTLSRFAGHSSASFTMDVYVTPSEDGAAAGVLDMAKLIGTAK